jgi:hypothetical protein
MGNGKKWPYARPKHHRPYKYHAIVYSDHPLFKIRRAD